MPPSDAIKVMTGAEVKALLKACGLTAKEAGRRIGRSQNMMTAYLKDGCEQTPAMALAALAAGLDLWSAEREPAFAAVRALIPALISKSK